MKTPSAARLQRPSLRRAAIGKAFLRPAPNRRIESMASPGSQASSLRQSLSLPLSPHSSVSFCLCDCTPRRGQTEICVGELSRLTAVLSYYHHPRRAVQGRPVERYSPRPRTSAPSSAPHPTLPKYLGIPDRLLPPRRRIASAHARQPALGSSSARGPP